MGDDVFSVEYQNYKAKGWIDFYPLQLFADRKSGLIRYRCQYFKQRLIAKATLVFRDDYVDSITDKAEAARLDIYPGTLRFFLRESRGSIKIAKIDWADPGKKFAFLGPAPIVKLVKAEDIEKQREIDRLDRIAKYRPAQAAFRSEL